MKTVFDRFDKGTFTAPCSKKNFDELAWNAHPVFEGVELKHILTAQDTNGEFSFHLVRIAPGKSIGEHIHKDHWRPTKSSQAAAYASMRVQRYRISAAP